MAPKPRKRKDTLIGTIREKHPGFAEGIIRADAKFETLKRKLGLPEDASENQVLKELKKR
jgi:hypothetical protein